MAKKNKTDYEVSAADFVAAWQKAETIEDVTKATGMPAQIAHARASAYRKMGVNLKKLKRSGKNTLDVEALNKLIDQIEAQQKREQERPPDPPKKGLKKVEKSNDD